MFGFDAANQKTSEAWYAAGGSLVQTQTFGYDAAGYLVSANDPDGNYTIGRDALNRASAVATPGGVTLAFAFDAAGNRTSVSDSTGGVQTSTFDLANRLMSRSLDAPTGGDLRVDFTYTDRDERKSMTRFSDLAGTTKVGDSSYTFDAGGRLTNLQNRTGSSAVIGDYAYQYDLDNRLTQKTENGVSTSFAYDKLGQVTSANGKSLSYDATGNRTTSGYVTVGGNRVTSDGTWTYSYDLDGNQVGKSKSGESWSYAYDHRGQMTQATSDTGVSVTYKFDAFGNRIQRNATVSGVSSVEKFVVDGWDTTKPRAVGTENFDTILDLDGSGNVTNRRMFGSGFDDVVGRQDAAGGVKWYATDRLGSVRQVFDNAGNVSGTTDYDAFGGFLGGVSVDRYAFTGREVDAALGLQYSRGRMYDSATGRWMGEDPIRTAAGDANLYRYVGNGATNARDPSGLYPIAGPEDGAEGIPLCAEDAKKLAGLVSQLREMTPGERAEYINELRLRNRVNLFRLSRGQKLLGDDEQAESLTSLKDEKIGTLNVEAIKAYFVEKYGTEGAKLLRLAEKMGIQLKIVNSSSFVFNYTSLEGLTISFTDSLSLHDATTYLYNRLKANLTSGLNLEGVADKLVGRFSKALRDADPNDPIANDIDEIAELWAAEVNFGIAAVKAAAGDKAREVCAGGVVAGLALAAKKIVDAGKKSIAKWRAKHAPKSPVPRGPKPVAGTNPGSYLDEAVAQQGLPKAPVGGLKQKWSEGGFDYEVRVHPADPAHGKTGSIYRVARRNQAMDVHGQGTGWEYMDSTGKWHPESTLKPGKAGHPNPTFNDAAVKDTHIQLP